MFCAQLRGYTVVMAEENKNANASNNGKPTRSAKAAIPKSGETASRTGTAARRKAEADGDRARQEASRSASKAHSSALAAEESAKSGTRAVGAATTRVGRVAAGGVHRGKQAAISAGGKVASTAVTAWTVVKNRKVIAAGAGAGLAGVMSAAFAAGRHSAKTGSGPLTRLTGGRI